MSQGNGAEHSAASQTLAAQGESDGGLLQLHGLTVERGGRAVVRNVSIDIPAAEVTALLGPNGAGKSSLVLAVGGVLGLRAGSVTLNGTNLAGRRPERIRQAGIAIVPEGRRLLPDLTVEDNIRVASYALSGDDARAGRERVLGLFPEIARRLSARARLLSGGEQQMLVLAQALIARPRFLLIDELSLGLAPVVVSRLIPTIREVAESGIGILLIEQFATVALGLANRTYIMEGGQLRFSGQSSELREHPDLLRSAYLLRGSTDRGERPPATPVGTGQGERPPATPVEADPGGRPSGTRRHAGPGRHSVPRGNPGPRRPGTHRDADPGGDADRRPPGAAGERREPGAADQPAGD